MMQWVNVFLKLFRICGFMVYVFRWVAIILYIKLNTGKPWFDELIKTSFNWKLYHTYNICDALGMWNIILTSDISYFYTYDARFVIRASIESMYPHISNNR